MCHTSTLLTPILCLTLSSSWVTWPFTECLISSSSASALPPHSPWASRPQTLVLIPFVSLYILDWISPTTLVLVVSGRQMWVSTAPPAGVGGQVTKRLVGTQGCRPDGGETLGAWGVMVHGALHTRRDFCCFTSLGIYLCIARGWWVFLRKKNQLLSPSVLPILYFNFLFKMSFSVLIYDHFPPFLWGTLL